VSFVGTAAEAGGVDDVYYLILRGDGLNARTWHALVSRADWLAAEPRQPVVLRGVLRLHTAAGERFSVIYAADLVK
jgi:hypothetical protein